jgi:hypothetical protein
MIKKRLVNRGGLYHRLFVNIPIPFTVAKSFILSTTVELEINHKIIDNIPFDRLNHVWFTVCGV